MYRYSPPICYRLSTLDFLFCFAIFFSSFYVKLVSMVPECEERFVRSRSSGSFMHFFLYLEVMYL